MTTRRVTIYRALLEGKVALPSLSPLSLDDLREFHWFDPKLTWSFEQREEDVPFEVGATELWEGDVPHVHYPCFHCGKAHNFDLEGTDGDPRLAVCEVRGMAHYTLVSWKV